jgi:hypothetical protein
VDWLHSIGNTCGCKCQFFIDSEFGRSTNRYGAGLLIRSFWKLQSVDPGFRPDRLLTLSFQLPIARYEEIPKQEDFFAKLDERAKNLPGIESAAIISELPLAGSTIYSRQA